MNREIKFRAWDKGENKMFGNVLVANKGSYIALSYLANAGNLVAFYTCFDNSCNDDVHLMQYTGLKDKNGIEAYVGDTAIDEHEQEFTIDWDYPLLARLQEIEFTITGNIYETKRN